MAKVYIIILCSLLCRLKFLRFNIFYILLVKCIAKNKILFIFGNWLFGVCGLFLLWLVYALDYFSNWGNIFSNWEHLFC